MLDIGVIQWADIKHTLTTTAHLPHDFFANIFTTIEETQTHVRTQTLINITPEKFTKIVYKQLTRSMEQTQATLIQRGPCHLQET